MFQDRMQEIDELRRRLEALRLAAAATKKGARERETVLLGKLNVAQAHAEEYKASAAKMREEQLAAVLAENKAVSRLDYMLANNVRMPRCMPCFARGARRGLVA